MASRASVKKQKSPALPEEVQQVNALLNRVDAHRTKFEGKKGTLHRVNYTWVFVCSDGVPCVLESGGLPESLVGCIGGYSRRAAHAVTALREAKKISQAQTDAWREWFWAEERQSGLNGKQVRFRELATELGYTVDEAQQVVRKVKEPRRGSRGTA